MFLFLLADMLLAPRVMRAAAPYCTYKNNGYRPLANIAPTLPVWPHHRRELANNYRKLLRTGDGK